MEHEIWKPVVGYEGYYEISNLGRVKSVERKVSNGKGVRVVKEKFLSLVLDSKGYYFVNLCKNNTHNMQRVHQLVAKAFLDNPQKRKYVDHINTVATDNRVCNLRWVTAKENRNNTLTIEHINAACKSKECRDKQIKTKSTLGILGNKPIYKYTMDNKYVGFYESIVDAARSVSDKARKIACNIRVSIDKHNRSAYGFRWYSKKLESTQ